MKNNNYMKVKIRKRPDIERISLFHYVKSGVNPQRETLRNLVFKFKGETSSSELFRGFLAEKVSQYLPLIFDCKKEDLVLLCVPTSKREKLEGRYKGFCSKLTSMGLKADYETLYLSEDVTTKHMSYYCLSSGAKTFDRCIRLKRENLPKLKGKKVVIFDDVITNGNNIRDCHDLLRANGIDAKFLTLARTYNSDFEVKNTSSTIYEYGGGTEGLMKNLIDFANSMGKTAI
ncbi:MAG: hypothetical protein SOR11_06100 [Fusobacterium sp.]|uniref:hypothetical protein n=1 Tax=Fusobacterium sp. TaxID=68766 RepID=UPI0029439E1B|nr:hypothetical protein [Fusobacterium sp.]MDY3059553.1 hypothetical protein [Fusobacterium sp.]